MMLANLCNHLARPTAAAAVQECCYCACFARPADLPIVSVSQARGGLSYARRRMLCPQMCFASTSAEPRQAAALIIGNEILSGSITDTNTPWLAKLLYSQGVDLVRAEYIPDDKEDIQQTVLRLKDRVGPNGIIFSSGGIGPTHDDVTYESLAAAFGAELKVHEPTKELMRKHYESQGKELNAARLRMATLPEGAEVLVTDGLWVPLVNLNSVYILPGIPKLFQQMINAHKDQFVGGAAFQTKALYTSLGEGDLAKIFSEVADKHSQVRMGSYPNTDSEDERFRVKLQLESRNKEQLQKATQAVKDKIPTYALTDPDAT